MGTPEERGGARPEAGPFFTLAEVAKRSTDREAWLVIHDRVYDVTRFLDEVGGARRQTRPRSSPEWLPLDRGPSPPAPGTRQSAEGPPAQPSWSGQAGRAVSSPPRTVWLAERPFCKAYASQAFGR